MLESKIIEALTEFTEELVSLFDLRLMLKALLRMASSSKGGLDTDDVAGFKPPTDFCFFPESRFYLLKGRGVLGMTGLLLLC